MNCTESSLGGSQCRYNLGAHSSLADFRAVHPVTSYPHFKDWVEREAAGEAETSGKQILCGEKVVHFLLS
jgi:hypothetical protein